MANSDDQAGSNRPNVVFILVDNVGWGDIGCYGGVVPTPRIDALAGQGVRFKNYNVEAQCTPTRSAILSGRLPIRTGNCSVPLPGQGDYGLAPWEYTLGELFSDGLHEGSAAGWILHMACTTAGIPWFTRPGSSTSSNAPNESVSFRG
jgi:Sulfatase